MTNKMIIGSGGGGECVINQVTINSTAGLKVTCGFKPRKVVVISYNCVNYIRTFIYEEDKVSSSKDYVQRMLQTASSSVPSLDCKFTDAAAAGFASIDNDGFTMKNYDYGTCDCIIYG